MSELQPDRFRDLVGISLRNINNRTRRFLVTVAALPPAPNTFSRDAALQLGASDVAELENLCHLGLLAESSEGRYSIAPPVHDVLTSEKPQLDAVTQLVNYYARYADVFQTQVTAIEREYDNISASLRSAREIGAYESCLLLTVCLSRALDLRGDYQKWSILLSETLRRAPNGSDPALTALATIDLARLELKSGKFSDAEAHAGKVLELNPADPIIRANALITLGHVLLDKGELERARNYLDDALALARKHHAPSAARQAIVILGAVLTRMGDYSVAAFLTKQAIADAEQAGDLAVFASLATNLGVVYYYQGLYAEAVEIDERGLAVARQIRFREKEGALLQAKGGALIELGRAQQALTSLNEALTIFREIGHRWYIGITLKEQGEAYLNLGQIEECIEQFQLALEESGAEAQDVRGYSHWGLARAFRQRGDGMAARREAKEALEAFGPNHRMEPILREWLSGYEPAQRITVT